MKTCMPNIKVQLTYPFTEYSLPMVTNSINRTIKLSARILLDMIKPFCSFKIDVVFIAFRQLRLLRRDTRIKYI